jgi:prepilin-type N-terminal cleavage/methylation domain-containing protein
MLMTFSRFRSDQSGFSLIELLMSMALGSIVLAALMTLFMNGVTGTVRVSDRTEALQRGRITMDRVTTLLNSQTCLLNTDGTGQPPILDGQNNEVTFYASLGVVDSDPTIYRLRYDPATKRMTEQSYPAVRNAGVVTYPSYPASPSVTRVIGTNILPTTAGAPIFQYWQFITEVGPTLGMVDKAAALTTPLTSTSQYASVRMTTSFVTQPEHTSGSTIDVRGTALEGVATVGSANAGEPTKGVNC